MLQQPMARLRAMTEAMLKSVVADCWNAGATPTIVMCGSAQKQKISTFTGNATKFQDVDAKKLTAAVDIYISDFGSLEIVPNRHMRVRTVSSVDYTPDVLVLDPSYAEVAYLQTAKQEPLAKTGLSERSLISCEYGLVVTSQKHMGSWQTSTHHKTGGAEMPHPQQENEMRIKITSDRNPWANGSPALKVKR